MDRRERVMQRFSEREANEDFYRSLVGENDLGVVVRAHIHIEHEIKVFIERKVSRPQELDLPRMTYAACVRLALALGLRDEMKGPLTAIES